jgi:hypothetical protein
MDLRAYYQKIRKLEATISDPFVVITSLETADGGKPGVKTDVPKFLAARLIVEDRAEMASPEETMLFRAETERQWRETEDSETMPAERGKTPRGMLKSAKRP